MRSSPRAEPRSAKGDARGSAVDETTCVAEVRQRQRADVDGKLGEAISRSIWLNGCLESSRAVASFCEAVPAPTEFLKLGTWVSENCSGEGVAGQEGCQSIYQEVAKYCASPRRAAKLASHPT